MKRLDDYGDILTPEELADFFGLSLPTIYAQLKANKLPSVRLGRKIYTGKAALERLLSTTGPSDD